MSDNRIPEGRAPDSGDVRRLAADVLLEAQATLGEGPVWDGRSNRLAWVDILARKLNFTDPATGETESIGTPSDIGAAVPRAAGGWVAALSDGFWTWSGSQGW